MSGIPVSTMLLGLIGGIFFGFMIYKVGASKYETILKMLLLKDLTVLKFMITAVMVGSIGVFLTDSVIWIAPMELLRLVVGGLIFGVGFALLGGCPGTVMVKLGEGKKDAFWGILGGLVATAIYADIYPTMKAWFIDPVNYGKMTIQSALGVSDGVGLVILLVVFGATLFVVNKFTGPKKTSQGTSIDA